MKKLIRSQETKEFLAADGGWTSELSKARRFDDFSEVTLARTGLKLKEDELELYYLFYDNHVTELDVVCPLDPEKPSYSPRIDAQD